MSVISDIKMILESNNIHLLHDAKSYLEQIERWDAIKDADLVERQHGEWIEGDFGWRCSVCGITSVTWQRTYNYCPNCGADMRGDEDDGR